MTPEQRSIDDREWRLDENWSWASYASPLDSRVWVPKRNPALGWTVNRAHTTGRLWLLAILGVPLVVVALIIWREAVR